MLELLPPWPLLAAFLAASLVLAVTPGPGVFYIVTRSLAQGRRAGLASVAGVAIGNFGNALGASLGLAALFLASSAAFLVVKYAGAAYLIWLGIQAIGGKGSADAARSQRLSRSAGEVPSESASEAERVRSGPEITAYEPAQAQAAFDVRRIFRDGLVVALLNPKTAVFFAAFLPQFMRPDSSHAPQSIVLGAIFVAIAATTDTAYALAAGTIGPAARRSVGLRRAGRWASGGAFIGLGLYTALAGARAAK